MGCSHSHAAHPEHGLRRETWALADRNARCGMCARAVSVGDKVYTCKRSACRSFILHDACVRSYPEKIKKKHKHFSGRSLKLKPTAAACNAAGSSTCTICAKSVAGVVHCVYVCKQKKGKRGVLAHPRCALLPQSVSTPSHKHGLCLKAPDAGGGGNKRRCVSCNKNAAGRAWSYQSTTNDDEELCLDCVLGDAGDSELLCCCCCSDKRCVDVAAAVGQVVRAFTCGLIGL